MSAHDSFDARQFDRRYEDLAALPSSIHAEAVLSTQGDLLDRARGLLEWRKVLLAGGLPDPAKLRWPDRPLSEALVADLRLLDIARFCKDQPELVDALLLDVLRSAGAYGTLFEEARRRHQAELERLERLRRLEARRKAPVPAPQRDAPALSPSVPGRSVEGGEGSHPMDDQAIELDQATLDQLRVEASKMGAEAAAKDASQEIPKKWEELARLWADLADIFGELGDLLGRGWDLTRCLLAATGWREVARLRKLLEQAPQLQEIIRKLGRIQTGPNGTESAAEVIFRPIRRIGDTLAPVVTPLAPSETRGVERSDELTRMLASEAVLLTRPVLKRLWHAKRAERALMTYKVEGVLPEHIQAQGDVYAPEAMEPKRSLERGPILVCVDTSGSMNGTPEAVAKALALEAARVAFVEKRACHLYIFSGPKQVKEHALSLTVQGLGTLLGFLTSSFHGGTDITEPLNRAVRRLEREGWGQADLLMVTDGEFPIEQVVVDAMKRARETKGLRSHVVLIGSHDRDRQGELFDHVHVFTDWAAVGGFS